MMLYKKRNKYYIYNIYYIIYIYIIYILFPQFVTKLDKLDKAGRLRESKVSLTPTTHLFTVLFPKTSPVLKISYLPPCF